MADEQQHTPSTAPQSDLQELKSLWEESVADDRSYPADEVMDRLQAKYQAIADAARTGKKVA